MPATSEKKKVAVSEEVLKESLEKSLAKFRSLLLKGKNEKEPGTTAAWEVREGSGRAKGSKDARDMEEVDRDYANDEGERRLTDMEDTEQDEELASEPWEEKSGKAGKRERAGNDKDEEEEAEEDEGEEDERGSEDEEGDEEEEKQERLRRGKKAKKSLSDIVSEDDESSIAMEVSPFLRKLVKSQERYLDQYLRPLLEEVRYLRDLTKSQGRVILQNVELSKAIAGTPIPIGSSLRKSGNGKPLDGTRASYDPEGILRKSEEYVKKGTISVLDGIRIEEWVNGKRAELPANLQPLFESKSA